MPNEIYIVYYHVFNISYMTNSVLYIVIYYIAIDDRVLIEYLKVQAGI